MACDSRPSGASMPVTSIRAGLLKPCSVASMTAQSSSSHGIMPPDVRSSQMAPQLSTVRAWVSRISRYGLLRSATAPASGATQRAAIRSLSAIAPTHAGEWVRSQASQPTAVFCAQAPMKPAHWAMAKTMKLLLRGGGFGEVEASSAADVIAPAAPARRDRERWRRAIWRGRQGGLGPARRIAARAARPRPGPSRRSARRSPPWRGT